VTKTIGSSCREQHTRWQQIGEVLGVSRQAALRRYGKPIER
jgi:hypothetical protein